MVHLKLDWDTDAEVVEIAGKGIDIIAETAILSVEVLKKLSDICYMDLDKLKVRLIEAIQLCD